MQVSHTFLEWVKNYIYNLPFFFWFIWSLLICSVVVIIINKLFKDSLIAYFLFFIIIVLFPNGLGFYFTKYMIPYFFAGYLIHKNNLKANNFLLTSSFLVFIIMWYFWKYEYYIYTTYMATHLYDLKGIYDDLYRYIAGFTGILVFITLSRQLPNLAVFKILGKHTFGIYIIGSFFNQYLYLLQLSYDPILYNFIYTPLVAFIIITICIGISVVISKSVILNKYLLGGR